MDAESLAKMEKNKRKEQSRKAVKSFTLRLNEREMQVLDSKMETAGITNRTNFIKQLILGGNVINPDLSVLHEIRRLVSISSKNINQVALRANTTGSVYELDVVEIEHHVKKMLVDVNKAIRFLYEELKFISC